MVHKFILGRIEFDLISTAVKIYIAYDYVLKQFLIFLIFIYSDEKAQVKYYDKKQSVVEPFCVIYHELAVALYCEF